MSPVFEAVSKDLNNKYIKERVSAANVKEARTQLRERGLMPMEIKPVSGLAIMIEGVKASVAKAKAPEDRASDRKRQVEELKAQQKANAKKRWFKYEAIHDDSAELVTGLIKAADAREARLLMREQRLIPKTIQVSLLGSFQKDAQTGPKVKKEKNYEQNSFEKIIERIFPPKVTTKDLTLMAQQLAAMTAAGLPILGALNLLRDVLSNKFLIKIVTEIIDQVSQGVSFGEAIKEYPDVFPSLFIELVDMGEQTGNLDENIKRLADYMAKQLELQQKVKSAMTYPMIVLGILVLIVVGLMIFIVPTFLKLFEEFKVELPITTQILLWMSWFVLNRFWTVPIVIFPTMFIWKHLSRTALFKFIWDKVEFKIPIFGDLNYKVTITHMLANLSISLRSGLTVIRALDSVYENTRNHMLKEKLAEINENVKMGARLGVVVLAAEIFPPLVNRLIAVGDETGGMDDMLHRAAAYMDNEVEESVKALTAAIEPMMTLFLGGTVMFIVASLYFPLMGIMGGKK